MKNTKFKILLFLTKNPVDFWTKYKFSFKSFQLIQRVRKLPLGQCLGLSRDQGQKNSPQKMKSGLELNRKFFVRALFSAKTKSQRSFTTRRGPQGHKKVRNLDFKIWSLLAKIPGQTPWQKVNF